jgi:hypothetical protein
MINLPARSLKSDGDGICSAAVSDALWSFKAGSSVLSPDISETSGGRCNVQAPDHEKRSSDSCRLWDIRLDELYVCTFALFSMITKRESSVRVWPVRVKRPYNDTDIHIPKKSK